MKQIKKMINKVPFGGNYYYLAHPFLSRQYVREWELEFEERSGINLINPFYDVSFKNIYRVDNGSLSKKDLDKMINPKQLVEKDIRLIQNSRGVVAFVDSNESIGTIQEMVYGKLNYKPVYCLVTVPNLELHAWIRYHSTYVFKGLGTLEAQLLRDAQK